MEPMSSAHPSTRESRDLGSTAPSRFEARAAEEARSGLESTPRQSSGPTQAERRALLNGDDRDQKLSAIAFCSAMYCGLFFLLSIAVSCLCDLLALSENQGPFLCSFCPRSQADGIALALANVSPHHSQADQKAESAKPWSHRLRLELFVASFSMLHKNWVDGSPGASEAPMQCLEARN